MKEDFLQRYAERIPLRERQPEWIEAQRQKFRLGGAHAVVTQTHKIIGGLYERFVLGEGWTEKQYVLALEECFLAGVSLTRAQVVRGRAAAEAKGLLS